MAAKIHFWYENFSPTISFKIFFQGPNEIRLVNGSTNHEGRIEIKHNGVWGTICDDDFNEDAAKVVCKRLGYIGKSSVKKDSFFGPGKEYFYYSFS